MYNLQCCHWWLREPVTNITIYLHTDKTSTPEARDLNCRAGKLHMIKCKVICWNLLVQQSWWAQWEKDENEPKTKDHNVIQASSASCKIQRGRHYRSVGRIRSLQRGRWCEYQETDKIWRVSERVSSFMSRSTEEGWGSRWDEIISQHYEALIGNPTDQ